MIYKCAYCGQKTEDKRQACKCAISRYAKPCKCGGVSEPVSGRYGNKGKLNIIYRCTACRATNKDTFLPHLIEDTTEKDADAKVKRQARAWFLGF
jgi:hypothetical protein